MKNRKFWISLLAGILAGVMLISLVAGLLPRARAASSSEIREQINELEDTEEELRAQMEALESQMSDNLNEIQQIVEQKKRIDQQVFLLHEQIDNTNEQIAAYGVLIADKQEELDAAEEQYRQLSDKNRERIRAMEEDGTLSYWSVLFKANSFADLLDRLNMIEEIAASDQRRLRELSDAANKVAVAQEELETEKQNLEQKRQGLSADEETLAQKREEANALLADLNARGEEFEQLMAQSEEEQNRVMEEIARMEDEYDEAVYQEWLATYVPPTTTAPPPTVPPVDPPVTSPDPGEGEGGGSSGDTYWVTPVPYYVLTSPFGMRIHPIYGYWAMHNGVDLACDEGTPIYASRSGIVRVASYNDSCGYYVSINHGDGYASIYMHMTHYIVSAGEYVTAGQVIGYVGSTGEATGPHLHFGISLNGTYVDPMDYIG